MRRILAFGLVMLWGTTVASAQILQPFDLDGMTVTSLAISPPYFATPYPYFLLAGTDSHGVFLRDLSSPDSDWVPLGLENKRIVSVYIYYYEMGPAGFNILYAGVEPNGKCGDSTLLYSYSFPEGKWVPADSGIDRRMERITAIGGIFFFGHEPPQPFFAGGDGHIYRSWNMGVSWEEVFALWASLDVLKVYQPSGHVWAGGGGFGYTFAPWVARTTDRGVTWEVMYPDVDGDNAVLSLAVHPVHPDTVYAGIRGAVIRTCDGGKTWNFTTLREDSVTFHALAIDSGNPEHIFAGGVRIPNSLALYESFDGGTTWSEIREPYMRIELKSGISSLVADPQKAGVLYIATFGSGVWRFESWRDEVRKEDRGSAPEGFALRQNYPNPFNSSTLIRYQLPVPAHVSLKIYNLLGQEVRTLVDRAQEAGYHEIRWDGKNEEGKKMSSGVYFCKMESTAADNKFIETVKLLLLR